MWLFFSHERFQTVTFDRAWDRNISIFKFSGSAQKSTKVVDVHGAMTNEEQKC